MRSLSRDLWQIASGTSSRRYADWMIANRLVLVGSSNEGHWEPGRYRHEPSVSTFARKPKRGDLVVLKEGVRVARAVGVLGDYDFSEDLLDVEGWDMGHYRPVRWITTTKKTFGGRPLARARFSGCDSPVVRSWVADQIQGKALRCPTHEIAIPALGPALHVASQPRALRAVIKRADEFHHAARWGDLGVRPAESELLAHITVPLLNALGWPPMHIAIGWKYTDVALFNELARRKENCVLLLEGKRLGDGLSFARTQVQRYAKQLGHHVLVGVTDGIRYRLYRSDLPDDEIAYANLARPRKSAQALFEVLAYDSVITQTR